MSNDEVKIEAVERLKARIPEDRRSQVMRILSVLFPQGGKWFEGKDHYNDESFIETTRRRGVGSAAGYDTYFGLHPSSDAIPKAVVNELMSKLDDADECERIIRAYMGRTNGRGELMIGKLLDELRVQFRHPGPATPQQGLLDALFRVGEGIISIDREGGMFELSPRAQLMFLIRNMLEQWGSEEAGTHLVEAFLKAGSTMFLAEQFMDRGRELRIFKSDSTEAPAITAEAFAKLGELLLGKIKHAEAEGTLAEAAYYFGIARAWAYLAGADQPKHWLTSGMLESADFMAKAARGLVSYSLGTPVRRYTLRDNPDRDLFDLGVLLEAGRKHLADADLTDDQRNIITAVVRGAEHLSQGRSPETEDL